ncbi:LysR family transcriptional regulator [Variovorax arabinosiphilus]|uniref:LysR family transcriptional regulator n=1 Tax=Variovorax arabinosiphilus TaxID=3053498 RepID=UPI002578396A|nr:MULTISPECIES: LysR family transcriptional regulator [unclassified Variovorax]MDM0123183.1 LysR family transcriptional regulator [Variovorax sp. J2L1-78]MDM0131821.1 LysR family transcriptional regulator [Variovorax sp. J2L1-63]MDM0235946.1 LysR family transcriptional regulator [Variovorax sp. J2R1-6]
MDKLDQYRVFVQVAEMGSFIKAAHALELPRATVSAAVQQLEEKIGARLLNRTTRQVHLTTDGVQLLERVRLLLADADDVEQLFQTSQRQVAGQLRIDVPSRIARRLIAPALPGLLRRYPRLQLVLGSTDRAIDLLQEGVDCAVRIGTLHDSSLVVRPLGHIALINCASPAYLREYGVPEKPEDLLKGHWAVGYASPTSGRALPWEHLDASGRTQNAALPSRVIVNNAESYIAGCRAGTGLIQIPRFDVQHLLDRGELVEVMPAHRAASMPVSLLYPHRRQRSRRLVAFIEWFSGLMEPHLERTV